MTDRYRGTDRQRQTERRERDRDRNRDRDRTATPTTPRAPYGRKKRNINGLRLFNLEQVMSVMTRQCRILYLKQLEKTSHLCVNHLKYPNSPCQQQTTLKLPGFLWERVICLKYIHLSSASTVRWESAGRITKITRGSESVITVRSTILWVTR